MILLCLALSIIALLLLGLATDRQHQRWRHRRIAPVAARRMRRAAWVLLATGFVAATAKWGAAIGAAGWIGLAMTGAAASFLLLNLVPPPAQGSSSEASP